MGLPSKKRTPRSRDDRRSHHALKQTTNKKCEKCGEPVLPHRACAKCGTYKGRQVINFEKRLTRSTRSKKTA
ncbi:MAG: 50S ribosomal protein L32 [Candidatus Magasanikbacteria bacterium CG10_big_fil_rev_8_21_14_0_10_36_16]|uniref:Large ribosomal subunit protein bL32 n=1 Tax=Candidatus Magasanikbacteria bacterium CG10_big_fil_rev_8_21_14_0_10_36_16 TaxID=1974645 RepID=A0A2H0TY14_9BACT|nr:MAG: 50S ribosomal protein L32 [Candidatus Magasanikbacteria bacterium CG10_big_fil_rev_8_21_14_0_10_36_16]